ncbi:MAG TPA: sigma-70 family RNA polymerase sigma factor [Tepidisphaeraceae bacterium]|jgi:RNA polymerase sigma factor (TIGR02999 family)
MQAEPHESAPDADPQLPTFAQITLALSALDRGDGQASDQLLKLVYSELRQLARSRLAREPARGAGMTLDATALVHEAYLRVVGTDKPNKPQWEGRGHFFGAAALAMRRILVERARHRKRLKHGGGRDRVAFHEELPVSGDATDGTDLIALDDALTKLEKISPRKAKIVSLRYFAGLTVEETATAIDVSPATVKTEWAFARAWLHRELAGAGEPETP